MKISTLQIHGIGPIADTLITLDKPLLIFYGEPRAGKSMLLNSVRWVVGGSFPQDIIRHGQKEAFVEITGTDGAQPIVVRREWYVSKDGTTKAREVTFTRAGRLVDKPVNALKVFANPFMLDQDHFRNMTEAERKKFMVELFGVDTAELDGEWTKNDRTASDLRAKIKGYGEIDLTPVQTVDVEKIRGTLAEVRSKHADLVLAWEAEFDAVAKKYRADVDAMLAANSARRQLMAERGLKIERTKSIAAEIKRLTAEKEAINEWLEKNMPGDEMPEPANPNAGIKPRPAAPDTSVLEAKIQESAATNVRAEQFAKAKARAAERTADEKALRAFEDRQRAIKGEKVTKLAGISKECGVPDLAFDEAGNFTFEATSAGMLSTSQVMRLSSALSGLYPSGFGVELLDRGESLGRSVFDYVKLAEAKKITVMATVVGQKPANVPERVGVFVVSDGIVIPDDVK